MDKQLVHKICYAIKLVQSQTKKGERTLTQQEIGDAVGVSGRTVGRYLEKYITHRCQRCVVTQRHARANYRVR